jgi:uncharacterized protein (TIGR02246 family)
MRFQSSLFLALTALTATTALAAPADDAAIRNVEAAQESAWNAHDAHAYAQLFAADAVLINAFGWQTNGSADIERKLGDAFSYLFAKSRMQIEDVSIRPVSDDLALAYVTWSMTGAKSLDGSGGDVTAHGIQTQLLRRSEGRWLIISYQNTSRGAPERALPRVAPPVRKCLLGNREGKCIIQK